MKRISLTTRASVLRKLIMTDLLTALQQQVMLNLLLDMTVSSADREALIDVLSDSRDTLSQIRTGQLLFSLRPQEMPIQEGEVNVREGVPDIEPVSQHLTQFIDALPDIDLGRIPVLESETVELWKQRDALDSHLEKALTELQQHQQRLSDLYEASVVARWKAKGSKQKSRGSHFG